MYVGYFLAFIYVSPFVYVIITSKLGKIILKKKNCSACENIDNDEEGTYQMSLDHFGYLCIICCLSTFQVIVSHHLNRLLHCSLKWKQTFLAKSLISNHF